MSMNRLAFLSTSLAVTKPAAAMADATAPIDGSHMVGMTPEWLNDTSFAWLAAFAVMVLLGGALLVLSGRITWRLGAIAFVGGFALLGGDAILDGAWTAIAVSP